MSRTGLAREMGLVGLVATGIGSMVGAAINVIPFTIQRSVPGIGPFVLPAYVFAALPATLAGLAYAILASAMPRAGGSYVYASRALSPYLGFVASFSQWFGLSVAIGVVSYVLIPFLRDTATALGLGTLAAAFDAGAVRLTLALGFLWTFVVVNLCGIKSYQRTLVPLVFLVFVGGGAVIVAGFSFDHADFARAAAMTRDGRAILVATASAPPAPFRLASFLSASALLFSSFIGFDSIAQAGGEAFRWWPWERSICCSPPGCITRFLGPSWPRWPPPGTSPRPDSSDTYSREPGRWRSLPARPSRWRRTSPLCCSPSRG